jgi:hypothetical protein
MYFTFTHKSFDVGTFGNFDLSPHVNLRRVINTMSLFQKNWSWIHSFIRTHPCFLMQFSLKFTTTCGQLKDWQF